MLARPNVRVVNTPQPMAPGMRMMDGRSVIANNGDAVAITVAAIIGGIVNRTGSTGATADSLPTVTALLAALPDLNRGDSFEFSIRMPDANAITLTVGTGMTAVGTMNVAASNIRDYLVTLTSDNKVTTIQVGSTSTASAAEKRLLRNLSPAELDNVGIGMAVTGTGVGASAKVIAINRDAQTVTVDVDSTATADNIAFTFTPQMTITALGTKPI